MSPPDDRDEISVEELPAAGPRRLYVVDPNFPSIMSTNIYVIDGAEPSFLGTISAGYLSNLAFPPDQDALYVLETYYSRGTRGERTDVATVYDARSLEPRQEVLLRDGRGLTVTKSINGTLAADHRHLLSYNFKPSQSVSIVDTEDARFVGTVETPGGAGIYPTRERHFAMLTASGGLLHVEFSPDGTASLSRSDPFFEPRSDPVFEHDAYDARRDRRYYVSFEGRLHVVDTSGPQATHAGSWTLHTPENGESAWRPGGWQVADVHPASQRLYVLYHRGPRWSHKQSGTQVWVFDLEERERVDRIELEDPAYSLRVDRSAKPRLYALSAAGFLDSYRPGDATHLGRVDELGATPHLLQLRRVP